MYLLSTDVLITLQSHACVWEAVLYFVLLSSELVEGVKGFSSPNVNFKKCQHWNDLRKQA